MPRVIIDELDEDQPTFERNRRRRNVGFAQPRKEKNERMIERKEIQREVEREREKLISQMGER